MTPVSLPVISPGELRSTTGDWGDFFSLYSPLILELRLMSLAFYRLIMSWDYVAASCEELAEYARIFCEECEHG